MLRSSKSTRRSWLRQSAVILLCLGLVAYFGQHAVQGRHGLEARHRIADRMALLEFEAKSLEGVRAKLRRDIALLSPSKPHPDMVEEVARDILGYVKADDIVIVLPDQTF